MYETSETSWTFHTCFHNAPRREFYVILCFKDIYEHILLQGKIYFHFGKILPLAIICN